MGLIRGYGIYNDYYGFDQRIWNNYFGFDQRVCKTYKNVLTWRSSALSFFFWIRSSRSWVRVSLLSLRTSSSNSTLKLNQIRERIHKNNCKSIILWKKIESLKRNLKKVYTYNAKIKNTKTELLLTRVFIYYKISNSFDKNNGAAVFMWQIRRLGSDNQTESAEKYCYIWIELVRICWIDSWLGLDKTG